MQNGISSAEPEYGKPRRRVGCNYKPSDLNHSNRPVRTRMPGGVGGAQSIWAAPYPDPSRRMVWMACQHSRRF